MPRLLNLLLPGGGFLQPLVQGKAYAGVGQAFGQQQLQAQRVELVQGSIQTVGGLGQIATAGTQYYLLRGG